MNIDGEITNQKITEAGVAMKRTDAHHPRTNGLQEGAEGDTTMSAIKTVQVL